MVCIVDAPDSALPIPAKVAAVWGGFLYEGLLAPAHDQQRVRQILDIWGCGCLELVMAICEHLPEVWRQVAIAWENDHLDFPGVFEYEVLSSYGVWLGDWLLAHEGVLPMEEIAHAEISRLIAEFFDDAKRDLWRGPLRRTAPESIRQ